MALQWGIIGTGADALEFAKKVKADGGGIRAVADSNPYDAFCFAKRVGIPLYYGETEPICTDKDIDAVYLSQNLSDYMPLIQQLLQAGKNIRYGQLSLEADKQEIPS